VFPLPASRYIVDAGGGFTVLPTFNATVFVDGRTGEANMKFPTVSRGIVAKLIARDASLTAAEVKSWTFDALLPDTDFPANGPHGEDCKAGALQRVDIVPLDNLYTCVCDDNSAGDNCAISLAATIASDDAEAKNTMCVAAPFPIHFVLP
jgi:hypothetical protein